MVVGRTGEQLDLCGIFQSSYPEPEDGFGEIAIDFPEAASKWLPDVSASAVASLCFTAAGFVGLIGSPVA